MSGAEKDLFGLIGKPLGHSFSAKYFNAKFERENIFAEYKLFELNNIEELKNLLTSEPNLKGISVTIPYKENVIPFLDKLHPDAKAIGAVNCIRIKNGKLLGFNTDTAGFRKSLREFLPTSFSGKAIILGNGGAAKAVKYVLNNFPGVSDCLVVSRKQIGEGIISYEALQKLPISEFPLIINATPLGMYPNVLDRPDFPYGKLSENHYLLDLIYNPEETLFMKSGKEKGAKILNGLPMLHAQAEAAWEIWSRIES